MISAQLVAQLREQTGAGMMDAKKALEETGGDVTAAAEALRKKGIAKAAGKADRATSEGRVYSYIHGNGKVGALVEVLCETDFVARTDAFPALCHDLAMHVTAAAPQYLRREDVPIERVEKEKEIYRQDPSIQGKPAEVIEKIIEGKLNKFYSEICLLEQAFIKDDTKTVGDLVKEAVSTLGENIQVSRFVRFQIG